MLAVLKGGFDMGHGRLARLNIREGELNNNIGIALPDGLETIPALDSLGIALNTSSLFDQGQKFPKIQSLFVVPLEDHDEKLSAAIRIGKDEGMQVFNDSLYFFIQKEYISRSAAFEISPNVEELKMKLKGIDVKAAAIL